MKKLSFKEYYDSKILLLEKFATPVIFKTHHIVQRYCKVPFIKADERVYISFKPKDLLIVEWNRTGDILTPLSFEILNDEYTPAWNAPKMKTWVSQASRQDLTKN